MLLAVLKLQQPGSHYYYNDNKGWCARQGCLTYGDWEIINKTWNPQGQRKKEKGENKGGGGESLA